MTDLNAAATGVAALPPPTAEPVERVPEPSTLAVPWRLLAAALRCVGRDHRPQLTGVYLHQTADGWVRLAATDSRKLLLAQVGHRHQMPGNEALDWLSEGLVLSADNLKAQLALIAGIDPHGKGAHVAITYASGAPHAEVSDKTGAASFRVRAIAGGWPDYGEIIRAGAGVFTPEGREDFEPAAFDPKHVKSATEIAAVLNASTLQVYTHRHKAVKDTRIIEGPSLITFGRVGNVLLYIQPDAGAVGLSQAERVMLAPAIKASVAALRAHLTRNEKAAKKATGQERERLLGIADAYRARIAQSMAKAGTGDVALPAPPEPDAMPEIEGNPFTVTDGVDTSVQFTEPPHRAAPSAEETAPDTAPQPEPKADAPKAGRHGGKRRR